MCLKVVTHERAVLRVERGEDLIEHLNKRYIESSMDEILDHFETDEPTAYDDRVHRRPHGLESGVALHTRQKAGAAFDPVADLPRVGHRPQVEDAGKVDPGKRRSHGWGARG